MKSQIAPCLLDFDFLFSFWTAAQRSRPPSDQKYNVKHLNNKSGITYQGSFLWQAEVDYIGIHHGSIFSNVDIEIGFVLEYFHIRGEEEHHPLPMTPPQGFLRPAISEPLVNDSSPGK